MAQMRECGGAAQGVARTFCVHDQRHLKILKPETNNRFILANYSHVGRRCSRKSGQLSVFDSAFLFRPRPGQTARDRGGETHEPRLHNTFNGLNTVRRAGPRAGDR